MSIVIIDNRSINMEKEDFNVIRPHYIDRFEKKKYRENEQSNQRVQTLWSINETKNRTSEECLPSIQKIQYTQRSYENETRIVGNAEELQRR